jgi:hypothetical protein
MWVEDKISYVTKCAIIWIHDEIMRINYEHYEHIQFILSNLKFHYRVHSDPPFLHMLSQMNRKKNLRSCLTKIHINSL